MFIKQASEKLLVDAQENAFYFKQVFSVLSLIIDRVHRNSPSMHFRRANTNSGGPIRIEEGQYGFRRANTEPSVHFRKAYTEPSRHFRRANTETYLKQNENLSKRVGKDEVFLWMAGLLLGISLGLCPWEIPRSSPASPWKTLSFPPILLRLNQFPFPCSPVCPYSSLPSFTAIQMGQAIVPAASRRIKISMK